MMSAPTSKVLVGEVPVDWEAVYADQLPRVYNFFRYRVFDSRVAEDLTATTFEKAWSERLRYRHELGAFSTWLFTIARNVATDYFRKERHDLPLTYVDQQSHDNSLEETIQRRADAARLSVLLRRLPERERELISLKYGANLTNRAIADVMGLTESNVGTLLHRGVGRLRIDWEMDT